MFSKKLIWIFIFKLFLVTEAVVESDIQAQYVVYFVESEISPNALDDWICGGAIIHASYVITAAACVEEDAKLFVVAGYKIHVAARQINEDKCTKKFKKRIICIFVPKTYYFAHDVNHWSYNDIAVARVDKPYNFNDKGYTKICSYLPQSIEINYINSREKVGRQVFTFGWGHLKIWSPPKQKNNLNQDLLHSSQLLVHDQEKCITKFSKSPELQRIIKEVMVCTVSQNGSAKKLSNKPQLARKGGDQIHQKRGICQNDHGGPLVTSSNNKSILIGVASVFRVSNGSKCVGPYLFTSTKSNGDFIKCILQQQLSCDDKENKVRRRAISWADETQTDIIV